MPTDSHSRCPSVTRSARAFAVMLAGALGGCGGTADKNTIGQSAAATGNSAAAAPAAPAVPARQAAPAVARDTSPFTTPLEALQGQPNLAELIITIEPVANGGAPADLLVTDPRGRRVGIEPGSLRALAEIPYTTYDSSPPPTMTDGDDPPNGLIRKLDLVTPPPGHYVAQVVGRSAGTYTIGFTLVTPRGEERKATLRAQKIGAGEVHVFRFTNDAQTGPLSVRRQ